jgi:hypothetical protein
MFHSSFVLLPGRRIRRSPAPVARVRSRPRAYRPTDRKVSGLPSLATGGDTRYSARSRIPRGFSKTKLSAHDSARMRKPSSQSQRSSSAPSCFPARLAGWHGKPPETMETPLYRRPSSFVMSGWTGSPHVRRRNRWHLGSLSQNASVSKPAACAAIAKPPSPEQRSRWVGGSLKPFCRR